MENEQSLPIKEMFQFKALCRNFETGELELDCEKLKEFDAALYESFLAESEDFSNNLKSSIKEMFEPFQEKTGEGGQMTESASLPRNLSAFKIINLKNPLTISSIKVENIGKVYSVIGISKRLTKRIPRTKVITFECVSCGAHVEVVQKTRVVTTPRKCSCKSKDCFRPFKKSKENIQEMTLEEMPEEMGEKQPQQLRVYLEGDLTDPTFSGKLQPGKRVEIIGIITEAPKFMKKTDNEENINEFILQAVNIHSLEEEEDERISDEDLKEIERISACNPLEILSKNLSPSIYGHDIIKKAIVLQLVKSLKMPRSDGTFVRGDLHILLMGDPGTAKSHLLKATVLRCPRARYVTGTKSSNVGLTCAVKKDELTGAYCLEAGLLVLASGSVVCLDEFEKMEAKEMSGLYEPLETQTVSVSKAGIIASLKTETSVLAAANPIKGKFVDLGIMPIAAQINLPPALLNRFDLIFIIIDTGNEEADERSVEHLFNTYCPKEMGEEGMMDKSFFKKYIAHARKMKPKVRKELLVELKKIYSRIRKLSFGKNGASGIPINLRNEEALIRLSIAHAKLRLSKYVELEDLNAVKGIFEYSLKQIGLDESGVLDISRLTEKVPFTKRGRMEKVLTLLEELQQRLGPIIPLEELNTELEKLDYKRWEIHTFLEQLGKEGKTYEPRTGYISLL